MKRSIVLVMLWIGFGTGLWAENSVPDRRIAITRDLDFYGADLQNVFDTTLDACQRICLANAECIAFTFNSRSNACFPKGDVTDIKPYEGAVSGRVLATDPIVQRDAAIRESELDFLNSADLSAAQDLALGLGQMHVSGEWQAKAHLRAADTRRADGDILNALAFTGAALSLTDASDLWVEYSRLALIQSEKDNRHLYQSRALVAAVNGYLRSSDTASQTAALVELAIALERNNRGRDMISALRLALSIQPRDDVERLLDQAIAKYGFRITETQVDSDAALPRICAAFSEGLIEAGVDYTPYVQTTTPGLSVRAEGSQICVDGVEHGARYRVVFREGLPAASGETLSKSVEVTLYVRDRTPSVRFSGRSYVLPPTRNAGLPIDTVNLETVDLKLRRVSDRNLLRAIQDGYFGRPMSYWQERGFANVVAETVWEGTGDVQSELNTDMTTRLPIGEFTDELGVGIYALTASVPGEDNETPTATQWFVVSDLGVSTFWGVDGLHVFVRSLGDATARPGLAVNVLSRANSVLAQIETDADGYALVSPELLAGKSGAAPALITVLDGQEDITFLSLTDPEFDLSDRGVEGRAPTGAIDAFVSTDRGAYRAGETVHATVLLRNQNAAALKGLPVTAVLTRPDGVEHSRHHSSTASAGGYVFDMPVATTSQRGTYQLAIFADPNAAALARKSFLVEDFLPERIDFDLSLPGGELNAFSTADLKVEARYLFGAPGAGLNVSGEYRLTKAPGLDGYAGYIFGRHDVPFNARANFFQGRQKTNADGILSLPIQMAAEGIPTDRPLRAEVTVRVAEGSGRPVERILTRDLAPSGPMIGVRPGFDGVLAQGANAEFQVVSVGPGGTGPEMTVKWEINRVETRYQWYQLHGNWNWEPITSRSRVSTGEATLGGEPIQISAPVGWGRHEIRIERIDGPYVATSTPFYAGWYAPADATSTPDTLEISLDKSAYVPGDNAVVRLVPRYAGKALVTVMSNRLIHMETVDVVEGENLVTLPVTDDWGAGAYVSATVIRPMDQAASRNPARALGLGYANVAPGARQLVAEFAVQNESKPREPMDVILNVTGVAEGEQAFATIAAVDVGILNLTGHESPDPSGHYFGQRKLGIGIRDLYGRLIDGMNGAMGSVRSGGDAANRINMQAPPPTEELVAFFSGPIEIGPDGTVKAKFDMPSFNGTVRLMAIVWSESGVGQAETEVLVRDPIVVTASLPRFLAPGDTSRMLLEFVHATGPVGRVGLDVAANGVNLGQIPSGFEISDNGKQIFEIPVTSDQVGLHQITVALTTPDGKQLTKTLNLPVQMNDPEVVHTSRFTLAAGDSFTFDRDVFADLRPGTGSATLSVGPIARFDAPGLLLALDRYPYGCTEQVTSKALPLLYLSNVADAMNLATSDQIDTRIAEAISSVLANQSANGSFGLWGPQSGEFWLDAYVSDFLSRAKSQGHKIPERAFRQALDNLRNRVNFAPDFDEGGEDIAYALHVLAREGAASMGDLRYYADVKRDAFTTPLGAAQLGAALAAYGDQTRADRMFSHAANLMIVPEVETSAWRSDYGTRLRDKAAVLTLAVESGSNAVDRNAISDALVPLQGQAPRSTQEAMWTLLATNALIGASDMQGFTIDGQSVDGPVVSALKDDQSDPVVFANGTDKEASITLSTFGVSTNLLPAGGNGYALERNYFTMDGVIADPAAMIAGERYVVVLKITPFAQSDARLVVNDPLPAGLEIDNPNLMRAGDVSGLDWVKFHENPQMTEFRQERFVAAVDWRSDAPFQLGYIVRAISPGEFHHPAASVEDMYRPRYRARTASGRVSISQ